MSLSRKLLVGVALTSLLLGGCTSKITEKEQYSGFLSNYSNLQEVTTPSGEKAMRWVTPSWNPNAYNTVAFKQLELYPAPKPNERVNRQTLDQLQTYMTDNAKSVLSQKYRVVPNVQSAPVGSRVLVVRAAITGVTASNEGMKWYEVVPVAAAIGATQAATGHRDQDTELFIEAEMIDASNGQTVAKVVRKVLGQQLKNASQQVTANDFKVALKKLTSDLQAFLK
jgi:ribosomal protein L7/L12